MLPDKAMARLIIYGVAHELGKELMTVGRASENLIHLDDSSVSMRHAGLRLVGGKYQLRDLGSTGGTRVNGEPVREVTLEGGERIRFGGVEARYEADVPLVAQALPVTEFTEIKPAELSARPVDFINASPFPNRSKEVDQTRTAIIVAVVVALLAFLGSMVAVMLMHAPGLRSAAQ